MRLIKNVFVVCFVFFSITASFAETIWYPLPPEAYAFGKRYPKAQSLLYAFDYGHALVYERLLLNRGQIPDPEQFEKQLLKDIFGILKNPPSVKVDEGDIAPTYVFTFPLTLNLFDWSHMLHQFVLDILTVNPDRGPAFQQRVGEIFDKYKSNQPVAITEVCKSMLFMDGHYFSKSFRTDFPSFNLLIWSYHWFQIKLYEALMLPSVAERDQAIEKTINDFWSLTSNLPDSADFDMMPEVAKEAPMFAAMFPKMASAFDNNHMLHDVISDILTSSAVPQSKIRTEGIRFSRMGLDPKAFQSAKCP